MRNFPGKLWALVVALGMTAGVLMPPQEAQAVAVVDDQQCWHYWWQEPQCTFCAFACISPNPEEDCCDVQPN